MWAEGPAVGARVGRYALRGVLGSGGFGCVYDAVSDTGERVAIKVGRQRRSTEDLLCQLNEIEALKRLTHPSLVRLVDFEISEETGPFLVMERIDGPTLAQFVRHRGPLDLVEALVILRRVAEAVDYCHALGFVHLDLKPDNVIITDPFNLSVKVLDFGLAHLRSAWSPQEQTWQAGTPAFQAPERRSGSQARATHPRVDLFSLGVLLHTMLAGAPPRPRVVREDQPQVGPEDLGPLPATVPEPVRRLIHALVERAPDARPASAAWLARQARALYFQAMSGGHVEADLEPREIATQVPLVGRAVELDALSLAFRRVSAGAGEAIDVSGESGVGKSRLISELLSQPEVARQALVAYGRCRELNDLVSLAPLREAIGRLARTLRLLGAVTHGMTCAERVALDSDPELWAELVPELALDQVGQGTGASAMRLLGGRRIGEALRRLLTGIAETQTVVLVIEDIQWADPGLREALGHVVTPSVPPGLLILTTRRPTTDPLPGARPLTIQDLTVVERAALQSSLLPGASAETLAELRRQVPLLEMASPLVTLQLVQGLAEDGWFRHTEDGRVVLAPPPRAKIAAPASAREVVQRRLAARGPALTRLLGVSAYLGLSFRWPDLLALVDEPAGAVEAMLREAASHGLVRPHAQGWEFAHDLVRSCAAETVPEADRAELHRRVAERLGAVGADPGARAWHLERAGEALGAATAYAEAGLQARRLGDPNGALRALGRAFELARDLAPCAPRDAVLSAAAPALAHLETSVGDPLRALSWLDQASALLPDAPQPIRLALLATYARAYHLRGDYARAITASTAVIEQVGDDPALEVHAVGPYNLVGRALCGAGRFRAAAATLKIGRHLAERYGDAEEQSHADGLLAVTLAYTGDVAGAERHLERCYAVAGRLGDPVRMAAARSYQCLVDECRGDWAAGLRSAAEALEYLERESIGGLYLYLGLVYAGRHNFFSGSTARAGLLFGNAQALGRQLGIQLAAGSVQGYLSDVQLVHGARGDAHAGYLRAIEISESGMGDIFAAGQAYTGLAHASAMCSLGSPEEVETAGERGLELLRTSGVRLALLFGLERVADAFERIDAPDRARPLREEHAALAASLGLAGLSWWPPGVARELAPTRSN